VTRRYRRVRFSIFALAVVVALAFVGGVAALRLTRHPDYWLAGAALVMTSVLPILGKLVHDSSPSQRALLDDVETELRVAVADQWTREVAWRIGDPYPLPVPFSVLTTAEDVRIMDGWAAIRGKRAARPLNLNGTFASIEGVFTKRDMPLRLVVLGAPGSGKSMIAQWLTVKLVNDDQEKKRVPVFLPLASWNPDVKLEDWAAAEMTRMYRWLSGIVQASGGRARTLAQELIAEDRVLMVLDGLDEIGYENQSKALDKLSEAAREDRHFVVTCRTSDYARIVRNSTYGPLAKTPVIAMGPLPLPDVVQYLRDTVAESSEERWNQFLNRLETGPDSALGNALSASLAVWLVRTYYGKPENQPSELLNHADEHEIIAVLLDGLVDAVYSTRIGKYRAETEKKVRVQRERLSQVADFLSSQNAQNFEWWHLHDVLPRTFTGGTIGTIIGCLVGACAGLIGARRFGTDSGVFIGIAFAVMSGLLGGLTSVRRQEEPRTVQIGFRWSFQRFAGCLAVGIAVGVAFGFSVDRGGGLAAGLITAGLVGPIGAVAIIPSFGIADGITTGTTGVLATGLAGGLASRSSSPLMPGIIAGAVFMVSVWIFTGFYRPSRSAVAASPESLLRQDRDGCIIIGVTAGIAAGVLYGLALGTLIGIIAAVGLALAVFITVSSWGVFNLTRLWLAVFRKMPLDIMSFLQEAYDRGVLRRVGGAYQFRHYALQKQLSQHASGSLVPSPRVASGTPGTSTTVRSATRSLFSRTDGGFPAAAPSSGPAVPPKARRAHKVIHPVITEDRSASLPRRHRRLTGPSGTVSALNRPSESASAVVTPAAVLISTTAGCRGISCPASRR
jgi:hypothetical protein